MKAFMRNNDGDERELLIDRKVNSVRQDGSKSHHSSFLEWAEASWIRFPYILFYWWANPILSLGYKRLLNDDDLCNLPKEENSSVLKDTVNAYDWTQMTTFRILVKVFWKRFVLVGALLLPYMVTRISQPLLISLIVLHYGSRSVSSAKSDGSGYAYAVLMLICAFIQASLHQLYYFRSLRLSLMIRNSVTSMIYDRLLSMNMASLQQIPTAHTINLVANDATKFEDFISHVHFIWEAPIEAACDFGLLYWIIGLWPALCGYTLFLLQIPLLMLLSKLFSLYRQETAKHSDQRIHLVEEIIAACQVIKIYHWEKPMEERVSRTRQLEFASIRRESFLRALHMGVFFLSVTLAGFATFTGAWLMKSSLTSTQLLLAMTVFGQMRFPMMGVLPTAIERLSNIRVALKRIDAFMKLTITNRQKQQQQQPQQKQQQEDKKGAIVMCDASFSWHGGDTCLSSLDLNIEQGTYVGIAGPVGSGKSSLFSAILGEMIQTNGQFDVHGSSFSYASQSSWIFADTLRANILLEKALDEQRYTDVLRACCLDVDLTVFGASGDLTILGEKGVNLSGGQKARVSLARALYADADIYLLDDPLAAVDHTVATRIYNQCIGPHGLLSKKTRLLITHKTEYLSQSHQTIILNHGCITAQGRYDELIIAKKDFDQNNDVNEHDQSLLPSMLDIGQSMVDDKSIISDEASANFTVSWSVWYSLFTAPPFGLFGLCLVIFFLLIGIAMYNAINLWVRQAINRSTGEELDLSKIFYIYLILIVVFVIIAIGRSLYYFYHVLNGANQLHNKMLNGILHTSMRFFESNPSGRILNRVSKDQQVIDELLPMTLFECLQSLTLTAGSVVVIMVVNPWTILVIVPLFMVFWILRRFYLRTGCQLKRLESVSRSPVYALFTSSLSGLATIRAFKVKDNFMRIFTNRIDANTRAYVAMAASARWFGLRLDYIGVFASFGITIATVALRDELGASFMALCLMYSNNIVTWFQWGIRQLAEAENLMTSAERIEEYVKAPREEDEGGSKRLIKTPTDWPLRGAIEFRNYSLCYRPGLEPALKNINLVVRPGEKMGIIGRTGAGKSSVFQGLLRLTDRSTVSGEILIDDVDISRITLSDLRSRLSVIPQQPILFVGTLRYNLDPFDDYSDEECWKTLDAVQLKNMVSEHALGLLQPVTESGGNFSVGQRQLICVARAILKQSRILLIDEATANVDKETDRLLQSVIAEKFHDRTVLTIAHRLGSVSTNDRLLVLDRGVMVDIDVPDKILPKF